MTIICFVFTLTVNCDKKGNDIMGRKSTKENKNIYQKRREDCGLTREAAEELLGYISADRIAKIESGKSFPHPDEVLAMAEKYGDPTLCNYYCSNECAIGQKYVPEVKLDNGLSQIVLEILNSLNSLQKGKERLIEITVDGRIEDSEIPDFIAIQKELDNISATVNALKLWAEKKLSEGKINRELYDKLYETT